MIINTHLFSKVRFSGHKAVKAAENVGRMSIQEQGIVIIRAQIHCD